MVRICQVDPVEDAHLLVLLLWVSMCLLRLEAVASHVDRSTTQLTVGGLLVVFVAQVTMNPVLIYVDLPVFGEID